MVSASRVEYLFNVEVRGKLRVLAQHLRLARDEGG